MNRRTLTQFLGYLAALSVIFVVTKNLPAGFTQEPERIHVKIEGMDYGYFDSVAGIEESLKSKNFTKTVSLKRDFVTDPSLYLWARKVMESRSGLKDIEITLEDQDGQPRGRYVLGYCQPLSWSVESASATGGFHERIDLAVQNIELF